MPTQWTKVTVFVAILLGAVAGGGAAAADGVLTLSTGMIAPWSNPEGTGFHQILIREVFVRVGARAEVDVNLASSRAFRLADDGVTDGLAGRVAGMEKDFPNLIRVPEPMFFNDFVACTAGEPPPQRWDELAPHAVAHIIGWQIFERNLPTVRDLAVAKDAVQLVGLLRAERTEVILHERWQALWQAKSMNQPIKCGQTPLARVPMYIYLNRKHEGLVDKVAAELGRMKDDGSYQALAEQVFGGLGTSVTGVK
ncbi:MAG: transporter substrate-binding domain-containing protein [Phaeospirillum sp.]|nr:transporter substrate-binding domain-containing protein [Phaeospirillum sp.]